MPEKIAPDNGIPVAALEEVRSNGDLAPKWLIDFRRSENRRGFYQSLGDYALLYTERSKEHLMVSFDNLSQARDNNLDREPWGYEFVAKNNWSQLGVLAFRPDWFRDDSLFDELRKLADSGFFRSFKSVTMTGTSMGGYGACAFSSLVPGCRVIAFSPQSTLDKARVPWENRFSSGRKANWSGPFADGAEESATAENVFLVYDPNYEPDVLHVNRFTAPNAVYLKARYSGHKSALFLRRAGILSTIVRETVAGRMSEANFAKIYRRGREVPWFVNGLANRIIESGNKLRLERLVRVLKSRDLGSIANMIEKRAAANLKAGKTDVAFSSTSSAAKSDPSVVKVTASLALCDNLDPIDEGGQDSNWKSSWAEMLSPRHTGRFTKR